MPRFRSAHWLTSVDFGSIQDVANWALVKLHHALSNHRDFGEGFRSFVLISYRDLLRRMPVKTPHVSRLAPSQEMGGQSSDSEVEEERNGEVIPSGSDESDSDREAEEGLREQVADVPFEELQKARSNGGASLFARTKPKVDTKRANKNRPMEITSKKPVPRFREVIQAPKREIRDPRFESLCGQFEESKFKSAYSFLYNEQLPAERQELTKVLRKKKGDEEVEANLTWIEKQLKEEEERKKQATKSAQRKSKEMQAVKQGKKPFYPKKSEIRKEELVEKFKELKSSGKLEKYMAKRRRKNAAKDHRFVPYRRNAD